jgi:hypothetical protein
MLRNEFDRLVRFAAEQLDHFDIEQWSRSDLRAQSKAAAAVYVSRSFGNAQQLQWEQAAERCVSGASSWDAFMLCVRESGFDMSKFRSHLGFKRRSLPA